MQERAFHISSVNRQKIGKNQQEDFIIKLEPTLKLDPNMNYELAMDRTSMTYGIILMLSMVTMKSNIVQIMELIGRPFDFLMECIVIQIWMNISNRY